MNDIVRFTPSNNAQSIEVNKPGLAKRLAQSVTYALSGGWFSPLDPPKPAAPESTGRQWDFMAGQNLWLRPKRDSGVNFETLRNFAQYYDILRIIMETRKDQVCAFDWTIVPKDEKASPEDDPSLQADIDRVKALFESPDGALDFQGWMRAILEDLFVLDAVALWPNYKGNQLVSVERIDAATIKMIIDDSGRRPKPPLPAYQQVLKGVPTSDYTSEELLYFMRNPRNHSLYGYSPVEQILMTVNIGLRREVSQMQFFTDGNIPEAIAGVPESWTVEQIAMFQSHWDSVLEGNTASRRKLKFVPGGLKIQETKGADALLKSDFDEWIVRIICYAFSVPSQAFIREMNRATAETAKESAAEEGLMPLLKFLRGMMNNIIRKAMKVETVEFRWNLSEDLDPVVQADMDVKYLNAGVLGIDDIRQRLGKEPIGIPAFLMVNGYPVSLDRLKEMLNRPPEPRYAETSPTAIAAPAVEGEEGQPGDEKNPEETKNEATAIGKGHSHRKEGRGLTAPRFREGRGPKFPPYYST